MLYYRVKPEKDNIPKRKKDSLAQDGIYIPKQNGASIARHIYTHRTRKRKTKGNILVLWGKGGNKNV